MANSRSVALIGIVLAAALLLAGCGGKLGTPPKFAAAWNGANDAAGVLNYAEGLAIDAQGKLLVADTWNDRIVRYDAVGKSLSSLGTHGHEKGQLLECPRTLNTDAQGNLYVVDCWNHRIQKFSPDGKLLLSFGGKGGPWGYDEADGLFLYPYGVAVDSKGNIFVSDLDNTRIQKFDAKGKFLLKWGVEGRQDGQFSKPGTLVMDAQDRLWVADVGNNRIQRFRFSEAGEQVFDGQWGKEGDKPGEFDRPYGLAVAKDGSFYVADFGNHRIQKFDPSGNVVSILANYGSGDGQLDSPIAVAVDEGGVLYVSDWGNNRIQKLQ